MYARYQLRCRMYCVVCPVRRYTNRLTVLNDTPYVGVMACRVSLPPNFTLRPWASGRGSRHAGLLPATGESLLTLLESAPPLLRNTNYYTVVFYNVYFFSEHSLSHNIRLLMPTSTATKMYIKIHCQLTMLSCNNRYFQLFASM